MPNKGLSFGSYIPQEIKKPPANPKYKNVKAVINTGRNVNRLIDDLKEQQINVGRKKDEIFMRIKFFSFVSLVVNVAKFTLNHCGMLKEVEFAEQEQKVKYEKANVFCGIGEIDVRNENYKLPPRQKPEFKAPYLLLDARDREQYLESHLKTAIHYPPELLSRSIGYEIEEMKQSKNSQNTIIILYDYDESVASKIATTLVERGYNNIYVLTGGWKFGSQAIPKKLWSAKTTDRGSSYRLGSCGMVQIKDSGFTQEDINSIELYVDPIPVPQRKSEKISDIDSAGDPCCSSYSLASQKTCGSQNSGSLTYRKGFNERKSACSLRSLEPQPLSRASTATIHSDPRSKTNRVAWK